MATGDENDLWKLKIETRDSYDLRKHELVTDAMSMSPVKPHRRSRRRAEAKVRKGPNRSEKRKEKYKQY
jgi:hypothetical protein